MGPYLFNNFYKIFTIIRNRILLNGNSSHQNKIELTWLRVGERCVDDLVVVVVVLVGVGHHHDVVGRSRNRSRGRQAANSEAVSDLQDWSQFLKTAEIGFVEILLWPEKIFSL